MSDSSARSDGSEESTPWTKRFVALAVSICFLLSAIPAFSIPTASARATSRASEELTGHALNGSTIKVKNVGSVTAIVDGYAKKTGGTLEHYDINDITLIPGESAEITVNGLGGGIAVLSKRGYLYPVDTTTVISGQTTPGTPVTAVVASCLPNVYTTTADPKTGHFEFQIPAEDLSDDENHHFILIAGDAEDVGYFDGDESHGWKGFEERVYPTGARRGNQNLWKPIEKGTTVSSVVVPLKFKPFKVTASVTNNPEAKTATHTKTCRKLNKSKGAYEVTKKKYYEFTGWKENGKVRAGITKIHNYRGTVSAKGVEADPGLSIVKKGWITDDSYEVEVKPDAGLDEDKGVSLRFVGKSINGDIYEESPSGHLSINDEEHVEKVDEWTESFEAGFSYSPSRPKAPAKVSFRAEPTGDTDLIKNYAWDFDGDGETESTKRNPSHVFQKAGTYEVTLTVSDDNGLADSKTKDIIVSSGNAIVMGSTVPKAPVTIVVHSDEYIDSTTAGSAGHFKFTIPASKLEGGDHKFKVVVADRSGDGVADGPQSGGWKGYKEKATGWKDISPGKTVNVGKIDLEYDPFSLSLSSSKGSVSAKTASKSTYLGVHEGRKYLDHYEKYKTFDTKPSRFYNSDGAVKKGWKVNKKSGKRWHVTWYTGISKRSFGTYETEQAAQRALMRGLFSLHSFVLGSGVKEIPRYDTDYKAKLTVTKPHSKTFEHRRGARAFKNLVNGSMSSYVADRDYRVKWTTSKSHYRWYDTKTEAKKHGKIVDTRRKLVDTDYKVRWTTSKAHERWFDTRSGHSGTVLAKKCTNHETYYTTEQKCHREYVGYKKKCHREYVGWERKCHREYVGWKRKCHREYVGWKRSCHWERSCHWKRSCHRSCSWNHWYCRYSFLRRYYSCHRSCHYSCSRHRVCNRHRVCHRHYVGYKRKCRREYVGWKRKCRRVYVGWKRKCHREYVGWKRKCHQERVRHTRCTDYDYKIRWTTTQTHTARVESYWDARRHRGSIVGKYYQYDTDYRAKWTTTQHHSRDYETRADAYRKKAHTGGSISSYVDDRDYKVKWTTTERKSKWFETKSKAKSHGSIIAERKKKVDTDYKAKCTVASARHEATKNSKSAAEDLAGDYGKVSLVTETKYHVKRAVYKTPRMSKTRHYGVIKEWPTESVKVQVKAKNGFNGTVDLSSSGGGVSVNLPSKASVGSAVSFKAHITPKRKGCHKVTISASPKDPVNGETFSKSVGYSLDANADLDSWVSSEKLAPNVRKASMPEGEGTSKSEESSGGGGGGSNHDPSVTINPIDSVDEGSSKTVSADSSDPDGDGVTLHWSVKSGPGSLDTNDRGEMVYSAPSDSDASDESVTLKVKATDGDGGSASDTEDFTINDLDAGNTGNSSPTAIAHDRAVDEGSSVELDGTDSSDPDGDSLSYSWTITKDPTGSASLSNKDTSKPTFNAPSDVSSDTNVTVKLTVSDGHGHSDSDKATVTVNNVPPSNTSPTAGDDSAEVDEGGISKTVDVLSNDTDPDAGDSISLDRITDTPDHGTASINDGEIDYTSPSGEWNGTATFKYEISDSHGSTATAKVTVDVKEVNDAPTVQITDKDSPVKEGNYDYIEAKASDPENDSLSYSWSLSGVGSLDYNSGDYNFYNAPDDVSERKYPTITVTVEDDNGASASDSYSPTVTPVSDAPVADANGPYTVDEGCAKILSGSKSDDNDGYIDSYSWTITNDPTGDAYLTDEGTVTPTFYAPDDVSSDTDVTVKLTVTDDNGATDTDTATVTVVPKFDLTVKKEGSGTVKLTKPDGTTVKNAAGSTYTFSEGVKVSLKADAGTGAELDEWEDRSGNNVSDDPQITVPMNKDKTRKAVFSSTSSGKEVKIKMVKVVGGNWEKLNSEFYVYDELSYEGYGEDITMPVHGEGLKASGMSGDTVSLTPGDYVLWSPWMSDREGNGIDDEDWFFSVGEGGDLYAGGGDSTLVLKWYPDKEQVLMETF